MWAPRAPEKFTVLNMGFSYCLLIFKYSKNQAINWVQIIKFTLSITNYVNVAAQKVHDYGINLRNTAICP